MGKKLEQLKKLVAKGREARGKIVKEYEKVQRRAAEYEKKMPKDLLGFEEFKRRQRKRRK